VSAGGARSSKGVYHFMGEGKGRSHSQHGAPQGKKESPFLLISLTNRRVKKRPWLLGKKNWGGRLPGRERAPGKKVPP